MTKRILAIAVAVVALAMTAVPALAHVGVQSSTPGAGKTAKTSLRSVSVRFSGPIRRGAITVRGPHRRVVSVGRGGRDPRAVNRLLVGLRRGLAPGRYTARWNVVAGDGHAERGSFSFRLKR
jgi:methionine-rich copper-binding protein CopC